jgi:hypothetical protein
MLASGSGDQTVRFWDIYTQTPKLTCKGYVARTTTCPICAQVTLCFGVACRLPVLPLVAISSPFFLGNCGGHSAIFQGCGVCGSGCKRTREEVRRQNKEGQREIFGKQLGPKAHCWKRRFCALWCRHKHWVQCIAWAPDATVLASGGLDNVVIIWDPITGVERCKLVGYVYLAHATTSPRARD